MKERPIIFSAPMVRAILEGRKTQTRRIVKPYPEGERLAVDMWEDGIVRKCPYGLPGDQLWVRETWAEFSGIEPKVTYVYRADGLYDTPAKEHLCDNRWRPSIYMLRVASRILLEITNVRVERLQEITEEDCVEEGAAVMTSEDAAAFHLGSTQSAIDASWEQNPWVWVIVFKKIEP